jgi:hypothetical protein
MTRPSGARVIDELNARTCLEVNVKEKQMRLPLCDRRPGAAHRPFTSADIASMPEGEIDGVRQRPVPEHNKRACCAVGISRGRCDRTHSDTDRRLHPVLDGLW